MNNTVLKSYAKINLFLKVGKKLKKTKLHNVQSLIYLIDLKDKILIKKTYEQKDIVKFTGKFNKNINKKYNSINKSLLLLRKKKFIKKKISYKISIKKNIPVFSGLGGGSSNAASIIQYFLKGRKISKKDIDYFSKYLGSDLKIFFKSKRVFQKNLFTIVDFKKNYKFYFLLVYPLLKGSTKEIYSKLRKFEIIKNNNNYKKNSRTELINELRLSDNSLEKIVVSKFPVVGKVLEEMRLIKNCQLSRVTGSGSACFALFLNKKDGAFALNQIKKKFPKFWCVLCKSI
tara:strand:- start:4316 stop:5176 length:861 start_codon:yes stop_codon:yes gene_type:complete